MSRCGLIVVVSGTVYDVGGAFGPLAAGFLVAAVGYGGASNDGGARADLRRRLLRRVSRNYPDERLIGGHLRRSIAMRTTLLTVTLALAGAAVLAGETRTLDFSADAAGQAPRGFSFGHTRKTGAPGAWVVQDDGGNKVLAQTNADSTRSRFPVAVVSDVTATDVDLSVRFKPISGRVDQAAGLVWRYQDEDNYYIVRANALEDNVVLYKVQGGKRTDLPVKGAGRTYGKPAEVPANAWSTLRVVAAGPRFEVYFNGNKLYEVEDTTFAQAGRAGVWTKADSVTQFDDLTIVTK